MDQTNSATTHLASSKPAPQAGLLEKLNNLSVFQRVSIKDKVLFAKEIATMLKSGLYLTQALSMLVSQIKNKYFKQVLENISQDIQEGGQLSLAMQKYPNVFDRVMINVVKSGEASGQLDNQLEGLGIQLEKQSKLVGKIKGALIYPTFVIIVMIAVGILTTVRIIPSITGVIEGTDADLPASTIFIMGLSNFMINSWYVVILGLVLVIAVLIAFFKSPSGRELRDRWMLKEPTEMARTLYMARFTRTLGMLVQAAVPIVEALKITAEVIGNQHLARTLVNAAQEVEKGIPLSVPLQKDKNIPEYIGQMISVGEQTGQLDKTLISLATYYEEQGDEKVKNLSSIFEPVIIVIIGLGVAFLVFSILVPIYNVATSIK